MERATITIIGGGFCGMLTAAHLCRTSDFPLKITIINARYPFAKGIAYSPYSKAHLLNVTAGKMSAYADAPDHFIQWLQKNAYHETVDDQLLAKTFQPRYLYGHYLSAVWKEALENKSPEVEVQLIQDCVTDIEFQEEQAKVYLQESLPIKTDYVVLATGNSLPRNPSIPNKSFFSSPNYFVNPWTQESVSGIDPGKDILILGNGLTMVDTVLGIMEKGFKNTIYSLSPHGYSLLAHRHTGVVYPVKLQAPYTLNKLVSNVKGHIQKLSTLGISAEPVIDSLRPFIPSIWMALSQREKESFLRHLCHKWGIARHRLPVHVYDTIQNLRIQGKLVVISGKVKDMTASSEGVRVSFCRSENEQKEAISVGRVINCTGPECNILNSDNALLRNLAAKGTITADPLKLGLNAIPDTGNILDAENRPVAGFFTLGSNLKGVLWESTAVPELRLQAQRLAMTLINTCKNKRAKRYSTAA